MAARAETTARVAHTVCLGRHGLPTSSPSAHRPPAGPTVQREGPTVRPHRACSMRKPDNTYIDIATPRARRSTQEAKLRRATPAPPQPQQHPLARAAAHRAGQHAQAPHIICDFACSTRCAHRGPLERNSTFFIAPKLENRAETIMIAKICSPLERVPATPKKWADTILVPNHQKSIVAVPAGTRQVGAPNKCAVPAHTSRTPKHVADLEF